MAKKSLIHYSNKKIKEENANINIVFGGKSIGKSYNIKHEEMIYYYFKTKQRFILLRRWREDITTLWCEQYFADVDIYKITDGKYNCISVYRRCVYLSNYTAESGKTIRGEKIGYIMALSTEQHFSSASFLDVDNIIFEEFMERGRYIVNEPDRLMILYNTVDRNRGTTKLWLIGNTITKVSPYLKDWEIQQIVSRMKVGDIRTKIIHNEKNDVKIAIEYAISNVEKTFAIGKSKQMIDSGDWSTEPQPKLPESYKNYKVLYKIGFEYQGFKFLGEYIKSKNQPNPIWFVKPYVKDFDNILVFSDIIDVSRLYQRDIYNLTFKNEKLQKILSQFRESNVFFSDDLTGTDFKNAIDFQIKR